MKKLSLFAVVAVIAGCGPGGARDIRPPWAEWPSGGEAVKGLRLHLQSGRDKYVKGKHVWLRARAEHVGKRRFFVDKAAGWAEAFVELEGPSGIVAVEKKKLDVKREFLPFEPGDSEGWEIADLKTSAWEIELPLEAGSYKATLVYRSEIGGEWNKLAVAGGKYEGKSLWVGEVRSNPVELEVVPPPPRKK